MAPCGRLRIAVQVAWSVDKLVKLLVGRVDLVLEGT